MFENVIIALRYYILACYRMWLHYGPVTFNIQKVAAVCLVFLDFTRS